jgi:hypothetical protein
MTKNTHDAPLILARLRTMYEEADPVPDGLRERVRFAFDLVGADRELATLCEELTLCGPTTRTSGAAGTRTLTFESTHLTICVSVGGPNAGAVRVDGWLDPPVAMRVELTAGGLRVHTMSDEGGRFVFDGVRQAGDARLVVHPTPGSSLELARAVETPPFPL